MAQSTVFQARIGEANNVKLVRLPDGRFAIAAAVVSVPGAGDVGILPVAFGDSASLDAFGRARVSSPVSRFNSQLQYDTGRLLWETITAGGGAEAHLPNESSVQMSVGTAANDSVIRQQRQYNRYQPGRSQYIQTTFKFGTPKTNLRQWAGYTDDNNGVFVETRGTAVNVCLRTFTGGSAVTTRVAQADWNLDKLDGQGTSGITLNIEAVEIFVIDLEWLGVGRVRVGFNIGGITLYVHEFNQANVGSAVYMTTANLPLQYGIENEGETATASSMKQICGNVDSEGGFSDELGFPFSVGNGVTAIGVTSRRPVLSIRPKATYNSIATRGQINPEDPVLYVSGNPAFIEVVWGGALTGASFNSAGADSITEFDIAASAISGGIVVWSGAVPVSGAVGNSRNTIIPRLLSKLPLSLNRAGAHPTTPYSDNLSIVATSFTGTATVSASLNWRELR